MSNFSQFYFAWTSAGDYGFSGGHMREDELVFSFDLKHEEGQFAELELEIANPYVGLLSAGRPLWAWFSWSNGSNVYPLFYGRLVAIPDDLFAEVIKIKLLAKPQNYASLQMALAESLKVLPYYDPVFIDDKKVPDPNTVLEGYSALWHCDRASHAVTISDIIAGEDGTVYFSQNDVFYDKVSMKLAGAPLLMCEIEAEVEWTQCDHTGTFEMKTVPDIEGDPKITTGITATKGVTPTGGVGLKLKPDNNTAQEEPPKDPTQTTYSWEYKNIDEGEHEDGDLMEESGSVTDPFYGGELTNQSKSYQRADKESGQGEEYSIKESYKQTEEEDPDPAKDPSGGGGGGGGGGAPPTPTPPKTPAELSPNKAKAEIAVEMEQDRKESIYVAMLADVQPVLAQMTPGDQQDLRESLTMNSQDLVSAGVATSSDGVYFSTARGAQSIEYLLMVARAHLLHGSRVIAVEWECKFQNVVSLSCRLNAVVEDPRLPGASVFGKIVQYRMSGNGDNGEFVGNVTINSSVGNGAFAIEGLSARAPSIEERNVVLASGTPVYVEEGYVNVGYQHYVGRKIQALTGDTSFEELEFVMTGLQLPVTEEQILLRHEYHDGGATATETVIPLLKTGAAALRDFSVPPIGQPITGPPPEALQYLAMSQALDQALDQTRSESPSWVEMEFAPVQNIRTFVQYETAIDPLTIPKQIDLSAS